MRLKDVIGARNILESSLGPEDLRFKNIAINSKDVKNGSIFFAIKGNADDGNRFIPEAVKRGASIIISEQALNKNLYPRIEFIRVKDARLALARVAAVYYGKPSSKLKVVGITGTNGKTTVSYLLEAILKKAGFNPGVIGTINYRFNGKAFKSSNTTPGPLMLQAILSRMRRGSVDYVLMEVSSHALEQKRTEEINFSSAIFTNLSPEHLDYHSNMKNYFLSKARLFKGLKKTSFSILNEDDNYSSRIKRLTKCRLFTYGLREKADFTAKIKECNIDGTSLNIQYSRDNTFIRSKLLGIHNVYNLLSAVSWALVEGIREKDIVSAIQAFKLVPGRLERIDSRHGFSVFVDYAHTHDALRKVIRSLRPLTKGRIIVIFGCGGQRDKAKRPKMGKVATELADFVIITNDNPRSENQLEIIDDIKKGIKKDNYRVIPERAKAIKTGISMASPGDMVIVAGKGHENYQILKDKKILFNDRKAVKECLGLMKY